MLLSKYAVFNSKKPRFLQEQEASGFLSDLEIRTSSGKISILGDILS